ASAGWGDVAGLLVYDRVRVPPGIAGHLQPLLAVRLPRGRSGAPGGLPGLPRRQYPCVGAAEPERRAYRLRQRLPPSGGRDRPRGQSWQPPDAPVPLPRRDRGAGRPAACSARRGRRAMLPQRAILSDPAGSRVSGTLYLRETRSASPGLGRDDRRPSAGAAGLPVAAGDAPL